MLLMVLDPDAFLPAQRFKQLAGESVALIKGARPRRGQRVLLPGEREAERAAGALTETPISRMTLERLEAVAADVGVDGLGAARAH